MNQERSFGNTILIKLASKTEIHIYNVGWLNMVVRLLSFINIHTNTITCLAEFISQEKKIEINYT